MHGRFIATLSCRLLRLAAVATRLVALSPILEDMLVMTEPILVIGVNALRRRLLME